MSEDDRRRVLRMVAGGLITVEEGAELLDALPSERRPAPQENEYTIREEVAEPAALPSLRSMGSRSLVIRVAEGDKTKVNLHIPLGLARAAGKFIPRYARHDLHERGIDLGLLIEGISREVQSGPLVDINDGDDTVYIGVE